MRPALMTLALVALGAASCGKDEPSRLPTGQGHKIIDSIYPQAGREAQTHGFKMVQGRYCYERGKHRAYCWLAYFDRRDQPGRFDSWCGEGWTARLNDTDVRRNGGGWRCGTYADDGDPLSDFDEY
jgi:hypothetical protein